MNRWESFKLSLFQARLFFCTLSSIRRLRDDFATLGIDPRDVVNIGKAKQFVAFGETMRHLGVDISKKEVFSGASSGVSE